MHYTPSVTFFMQDIPEMVIWMVLQRFPLLSLRITNILSQGGIHFNTFYRWDRFWNLVLIMARLDSWKNILLLLFVLEKLSCADCWLLTFDFYWEVGRKSQSSVKRKWNQIQQYTNSRAKKMCNVYYISGSFTYLPNLSLLRM